MNTVVIYEQVQEGLSLSSHLTKQLFCIESLRAGTFVAGVVPMTAIKGIQCSNKHSLIKTKSCDLISTLSVVP